MIPSSFIFQDQQNLPRTRPPLVSMNLQAKSRKMQGQYAGESRPLSNYFLLKYVKILQVSLA